MKNAPQLLILFACLVGATMIMGGSGIGSELGGTPATGAEGEFEEMNETLEEAESDSRGWDSTVGLAISSIGFAFDLIPLLLMAPVSLQNLGFPMWLAFPLSLPVYVIGILFLITVFRGLNLI